MTDNREAFEAWYDAQPDGRIQPWDVWQAATAAERERCAKVVEQRHPDGHWMHDTRQECADAIRKGE